MKHLKRLGKAVRQEIRVYQLLIQDHRTPRPAKFLLLLVVGYLALPFDLIPDVIPVIGQLDDALVVPVLILIALKLIPTAIIEECRLKTAAIEDASTISEPKISACTGWWSRFRFKSGHMQMVLMAIVILGLLAVGYRWGQTLKPLRIIRDQLEAIDEGAYPQAYEYLSSTAKAKLSFNEFVDLISKNSAVMECRDSTFTSRKISGTTAAIRGVLEGYGIYRSDVVYVLVKENDQWKIERFEWNPLP